MTAKTDKQLLIEKFCKPESINWPREMKILGKLLQKEPLEFWKFFTLGFKLNSLAWLNTQDAKKEIDKSKKQYILLQTLATVPFEEVSDFKYVRTTEHRQTFREKLLN
jgi:hypothetical protein